MDPCGGRGQRGNPFVKLPAPLQTSQRPMRSVCQEGRLRECSHPLCDYKGAVCREEIVRTARRGTVVLACGRDNTHPHSGINQEADPGIPFLHPEEDTLAGRKPLGVRRRWQLCGREGRGRQTGTQTRAGRSQRRE